MLGWHGPADAAGLVLARFRRQEHRKQYEQQRGTVNGSRPRLQHALHFVRRDACAWRAFAFRARSDGSFRGQANLGVLQTGVCDSVSRAVAVRGVTAIERRETPRRNEFSSRTSTAATSASAAHVAGTDVILR